MENEKGTTLTAITLGSKYFSYVRSPAPSHTQTLNNPFETLQIKWEVKYFIKKSSCVFLCASFILATLSLCVCLIIYCVVMMLHEHVYVYISIFIMWVYNRLIYAPVAFQDTSSTRRIKLRLFIDYFLTWHQTIRWWSSGNAGALGNAEYPFIAISPRSTILEW